MSDVPTAPALEYRLVVRSVLNPLLATQTVLVEEARRGARPPGTTYDPLDPIASAGGVPVRDARVVIHDLTTGDSSVAGEDAATRPDGRGRGVYRFAAPGIADGLVVRLGGRYRLEVTTPRGLVRASARVPGNANVRLDALTRTHIVDRSVELVSQSSEVVGTARYVSTLQHPLIGSRQRLWRYVPTLRVEFGRMIVSAEARAGRRESETYPLVPGFSHQIVLSAADSNFANYEQGLFDPFGAGQFGVDIEGGSGLLGAVVPFVRRTLAVTGTIEAAYEGRYRLASASAVLPPEVTVYATGASGSDVSLAGPWVDASTRGPTTGFFRPRVTGTVRTDSMYLFFQDSAGYAMPARAVARFEVRGDSLVGELTEGGPVMDALYVRLP